MLITAQFWDFTGTDHVAVKPLSAALQARRAASGSAPAEIEPGPELRKKFVRVGNLCPMFFTHAFLNAVIRLVIHVAGVNFVAEGQLA